MNPNTLDSDPLIAGKTVRSLEGVVDQHFAPPTEERVIFETGATRCAAVAGDGKGQHPARYDLIATSGLERVAMFAATVTSDGNELMDQAYFHTNLYRAGDSTFDHLAVAAYCLLRQIDYDESDKKLPPEGKLQSSGQPSISNTAFHKIPTAGLRRLAETYGEGAKKYGDDNWLKGMSGKVIMNHLLAHFNQYLAGDRAEDHLAHACWGLFALMHYEKVLPQFIDLHPPEGLPHR